MNERLRQGSMIRALLSMAFGSQLLLLSTTALAYPQFVAHTYTTCASCHYSPTGGGMPNAYGVATLQTQFGAADDYEPWFAKGAASGYNDSGAAELQFDSGADIRMLGLVGTDSEDTTTGPLFFPMLMELIGVAAYGDSLAYASVTARKGAPGSPLPMYVFSREHWLKYPLNDESSVRAGRIVLPFGIRQPDHTQYVREDFGFDKWDQSYALEFDRITENYAYSVAAFAGDLTDQPSMRQDRGLALTMQYLVPAQAAVGLSLLGSISDATQRRAASVFTRWTPWEKAYVLAELAVQTSTARQGNSAGEAISGIFSGPDAGARTLSTSAGYLRAGYFVMPPLDVFLETGVRSYFDRDQYANQRAAVAANWQIYRFMEAIPVLMWERRQVGPDPSQPVALRDATLQPLTQWMLMSQLHVTY